MDDQQAAVTVSVEVRPLTSWSEERVQRAYRLLVAAVRQLTLAGAPTAEIDDAGRDAELFGRELLRRGLL